MEAIAALGVWPEPSLVDRVDGAYRGPVVRDPEIARATVARLVEPLLAEGTPSIKVALVEATARLGLALAVPALVDRLRSDPSPEVRVAALAALQELQELQGAEAAEAVQIGMSDPDPMVRRSAISIMSSHRAS